MTRKELAELLKSARKRAGFTQERLAAHLGRSQSYVNKIEIGAVGPDIEEISAWIDGCGHHLSLQVIPKEQPPENPKIARISEEIERLDEESFDRLMKVARILSRVGGIGRDLFIEQLDVQTRILLKFSSSGADISTTKEAM